MRPTIILETGFDLPPYLDGRVNGEAATRHGVEVAVQNQLRFLPSPFDGIGVYANYTFTGSTATFPSHLGDSTLPGQSAHVGNLAASYEKAGFSGRVAVNFHGSHIDVVGADNTQDRFYDTNNQLDGSVTQKLTHNLRLYVDPDAPDANRELALFGATGYEQDREGLGIYTLPGGTGYIVSVDQLPGESVFHVYRREGEPGRPHDHTAMLLSFMGGADSTDGLDVTSAALGPTFADGAVIAMNSARRNFLYYRWRDVAAAASPPLTSAGIVDRSTAVFSQIGRP